MFVIDLLNLCIFPFKMIYNPIVMAPLSYLVVLGIFAIVVRVVTNEW